jgi:hypothetical protein
LAFAMFWCEPTTGRLLYSPSAEIRYVVVRPSWMVALGISLCALSVVMWFKTSRGYAGRLGPHLVLSVGLGLIAGAVLVMFR